MCIKVSDHNNVVAYLKPDHDLAYFHDVIRFLHRCPLSHTFLDTPFMDKKLLHHFWETAWVADVSHIMFTFKKQHCRFSSKDVADALYLPRDSGAKAQSRAIMKSGFEAIGPQGEFKGTIKKSIHPPRWKVLAEVLLRCFSSKTGGWNEISQVMQQMMYAIIYGYYFDYTGYVFEAIKKQLLFNAAHSTEASSIYPRFICLICGQLLGPSYPKLRPSRKVKAEMLAKHFYLLMIKKELPKSPIDPPITEYMPGLLQQQTQVHSSSSYLPSSTPPSNASVPNLSVRPVKPEQAQPTDSPQQPTPPPSPLKRKRKRITKRKSAPTQSSPPPAAFLAAISSDQSEDSQPLIRRPRRARIEETSSPPQIQEATVISP